MKRVLILLWLIPIQINAQSNLWYVTRGLATSEVAWAVDVDSVGNIYWAVEEKDQWPNWFYNFLFFKLDSNAQQFYQSAPWGGAFNDIAFKATISAPNIYLSGRTDSTANPVSGDALVTSFNITNGGFNWMYRYDPVPDYGYEEIDGLLVEPDGIYLTGWKQQQNINDMDFLVQKINFAGQLQWSNTWDYNSLGKFDGANGHCAMDANYIYVAGHVNHTNIASPDGEGALVCFSRSNGAYQWHVTWGGALYDDALGMTMSTDSMLYVVGYTGSFGNGSQAYLNKYSRTGQLKWSRIWGGAATEDTRSLVTDGDSIIYVVGATSSYGSGQKDVFVLKYDSAGTLIDSLFWGGAYNETAKDVVMYGDYLYVTGETESFGNGLLNGDHVTDGLLLKINARKMQAPDSSMNAVNVLSSSTSHLNVYPNPTFGKFHVEFPSTKNSEVKVEISNLMGQKLLTQSYSKIIQSVIEINLSEFPKGVYMIIVQTKDFIETKKVIISE